MARPRADTYADQRAQILAAAAAVFAERGYTAATVQQVATRVGVSKATVYHYFSDKAQLLEEVATEQVQRLEALVAEVSAEALPPDRHLQQLILRFMQAYAGAADAHRVLTEDVKFLQPTARQAVEDAQRRVVQAFAAGVAAVRPDAASTWHKPLAMLLFGMINWTFTWLRPDGAVHPERLAPVVVSLFMGGLAQLEASALQGLGRSDGSRLDQTLHGTQQGIP
jgi:AcrR family transcriptional regulator